ncbi:hypothetical protein VNO77_00162 [Canavalia gladiata]|uniref:Uncharacterized protein n=1 Tax=Canavalia gladiata TaxID=3824 RepID=A0AAN9R457_CANGL
MKISLMVTFRISCLSNMPFSYFWLTVTVAEHDGLAATNLLSSILGRFEKLFFSNSETVVSFIDAFRICCYGLACQLGSQELRLTLVVFKCGELVKCEDQASIRELRG